MAWQFRPQTAADVLRGAADALGGEERVDRYGDGPIVCELERQVAEMLGKEAALLFPSGTMAQAIALRIHCDARGTSSIAFHPTCQRVWILPPLAPTAVPGISRAEITIGEPALATSSEEAADLLSQILHG